MTLSGSRMVTNQPLVTFEDLTNTIVFSHNDRGSLSPSKYIDPRVQTVSFKELKEKCTALEVKMERAYNAECKDFEASISIVGSKGLAQIGGSAANKLQIFTPKEEDCKKFSQKIPNNYGFGHIQLYKNIVKTFSKRKKFNFPASERDSFNTTKLLNAFYRADEINKKVNVFSINESKRLGRKNEKISKLYRLR